MHIAKEFQISFFAQTYLFVIVIFISGRFVDIINNETFASYLINFLISSQCSINVHHRESEKGTTLSETEKLGNFCKDV